MAFILLNKVSLLLVYLPQSLLIKLREKERQRGIQEQDVDVKDMSDMTMEVWTKTRL
jgi:hypothetical protein